MADSPIRPTRREFLTSTSLGAAALLMPAPAVAQRPKLIYWCYQFLKESDEIGRASCRERV